MFRRTKSYCAIVLDRGCARAVKGMEKGMEKKAAGAVVVVASGEDSAVTIRVMSGWIVKPGHSRGSQFCDIGYGYDCDYRSGGYGLKEAVCTGSRTKLWFVVLVEAPVEKRVATRSEGMDLEKEEGRGEAGEGAHLVGRASSQRAQTVFSVLSKQGVHWRSSASWPGRVIANHIPRSHSIQERDLQSQIRATAM